MTPVCSEGEWLAALEGVPRWRPPEIPTIVVSPHPDDETLGAGGLIASQLRSGVPVTVIAVTDGEAAYDDARGLGELRCAEQEAALAELGLDRRDIVRLRMPDGGVAAAEQALADVLGRVIKAPSLLIAPWSLDPHPDHEACGRAAGRAANPAGVTLLSYMFWAWHRTPAGQLTALPLARFELEQSIQAARAAALSHHRSQLEWKTGSPILPDSLLGPVKRPFETYIIHD